MKNCSIVIGSLWGDEGKGHMTDILCHNSNALNVRFNGGAQASHTVVTPDLKRHAFRHFGAGTFASSPTYLSSMFIVNPVAFVLEREELFKKFHIIPKVYVNPYCIVTTLWDVYINQALETMRADKRHGSCGFGINETVERSKNARYQITVRDLYFENKLIERLKAIQNEYVEARLKKEYGLTIDDLPQKYQAQILSPDNIDMFLFYKDEFLKSVETMGDTILSIYDTVVFEGAQGLLLDQDNEEYYPHVTASNTGIKNVMDILQTNNIKCSVDIYYMSRCYVTRHGAGPMKNELSAKPYLGVSDLTNVPNEFQGSLRYSHMDFDLLIASIRKDIKNLVVPANVNVVFTCIDQLEGTFEYILDATKKNVARNKFSEIVCDAFKQIAEVKKIYATNGLTRQNFVSIKEM